MILRHRPVSLGQLLSVLSICHRQVVILQLWEVHSLLQLLLIQRDVSIATIIQGGHSNVHVWMHMESMVDGGPIISSSKISVQNSISC